jgi:molecular chaperone GrpE (heat shock protein)
MEARDSLQDVGRGIAQLHMRLGKSIEAVERNAATAAAVPVAAAASTSDNRWRDALLDLVDALDTALERRSTVVRPKRSLWPWRRAFIDPSADAWRGLALAAARAHEALAAQGITPMAEVGAFDATQQRAIDTVAALPDEEIDVVVHTHRRGWLRQRGGAREVLRAAHVTVRTRATENQR